MTWLKFLGFLGTFYKKSLSDKSKFEDANRSERKQLKQKNDLVEVFGVLRGFFGKATKKKQSSAKAGLCEMCFTSDPCRNILLFKLGFKVCYLYLAKMED